ncbi:hypothetical protein SCAR479_09666 [Seiridium cardinale]|uniref:2EXR domain-containing protein n=1 Tax=Seiridium cardinale TaxID=138064 RepID=A0ABR2XJ74_9PEZI
MATEELATREIESMDAESTTALSNSVELETAMDRVKERFMFRNLPVKIRNMIWEFAPPDREEEARIFRVWHRDVVAEGGQNSYNVRCHLPVTSCLCPPDLDLDDRLDYLMERVSGPLRYLALRYNDTSMLLFEMRPWRLDGLKTLTFIIEWQPLGL